MASRREFMCKGLAAAVLPVVAAAKRVIPAQAVTSTPFYKVIFDRRFSASRAFAVRAQQLGAPVHAIEGDITALWYHHLHARWKMGPVAMAGLTLNGALFCLDILARDHGMRTVFRREYRHSGGGGMANLVLRIAEHALEVPPPVAPVPHLARSEGVPESLVSWVIIPAGARLVQ